MAIEKYYKLTDSIETIQVDYRHLVIDINALVSFTGQQQVSSSIIVLRLRATTGDKLCSIWTFRFAWSLRQYLAQGRPVCRGGSHVVQHCVGGHTRT